jgi:hypothetical protein
MQRFSSNRKQAINPKTRKSILISKLGQFMASILLLIKRHDTARFCSLVIVLKFLSEQVTGYLFSKSFTQLGFKPRKGPLKEAGHVSRKGELWSQTLKRRNLLEGIGVDGMTILNWPLNELHQGI